MPLVVDVIRDVSVFAGQSKDWDALAARLGNPLLSHDWLLSCAEAFAKAGEPTIVTVRDGGRLTAAAPLTAIGLGPYRRLEILGASSLHEPTDFLYEDEPSLQALCEAVIGQRLPFFLQRIPAEGPVATALSNAARGRGWLLSKDGGDCPYLISPSSWDEYLRARSSQRRYDLRRARRRLEMQGPVEVLYLAPKADELDELLVSAVALEASGWKGRAGSAIERRPAMRKFVESYARRACAAGQLRLCFLTLEAKPVAMQLSVEAFGRIWVLKIGYDERWASCSPGLQLMTECIRVAIGRGIAAHEFLGNAEAWILPWAGGTRSHATVRYYPRDWRGLMAVAGDQARRLGSKLLAVAKRS